MIRLIHDYIAERFTGGSDGKTSAHNVGDPGSIPRGHEDPLEKEMATHSSILAMDRAVWWATVHGVTELDRTERLTPR